MSNPDRGPAVFTVSCVMAALATGFTILRLISKLGIRKKGNSDDWLTVLGCIFIVGMSISVMYGTTVGLGKPDVQILPEWAAPLKKSIYAFTVLYNPSLMATKSAILLLYIRMGSVNPFFRRASQATLAVVVISGVVLTFLNVFQCRPVAAAFTQEEGTCIDLVTLYLSSAPINVLTDLAILCLPLPILTGLRMEFRQKSVLVVTFVIGGFATIVDIVRIYYLQSAFSEELFASLAASPRAGPANFVYEASFSLMWSVVEVSVGLVCSCALVLKPLIMRVFPAMLHESSGDTRALPNPPPVTIARSREVANNDTQISQMLQSRGDDTDIDIFAMFANGPPGVQVPPASISPTFAPTFVAIPPVTAEKRRPSAISRTLSRISHRRSLVGAPESVQEPTRTFFDFVNMESKKSLLQLSGKESWWPVLFVSILFFLWGFAYGLLGTLNGQIQAILGYSAAQTIALHNAYWIAYFLGPLTFGYQVLSRWGFKATFITGLTIYAVGAMAFWPSSVLASFPGFFVSNFIIALGLSVLETAANPFIALAGPGEYSEARLNFAQGIQGVGSVLSPILAKKALFKRIDGRAGLFDVQWCYLAVALFVVFLAVIFFYVPLAEASDDELEAIALQRLTNGDLERGDRAVGMPARALVLWAGVLIMLLYVGAQESISYFWEPLVIDVTPNQDPFWAQAIGHAVFAIGRFTAAGLAYMGVPPRLILSGFIIGAFITSLLFLVLPSNQGALSTLILVAFFESAIFPTLFAMALRGQGRYTKFASSALVMAISGGAIWPSIAYGVNLAQPTMPRLTLIVPIILYGVSIAYPVLISSNRTLRKWVDPKWSKRIPLFSLDISPDPRGPSPNSASPLFVQEKYFEAQLPRIPEVT